MRLLVLILSSSFLFAASNGIAAESKEMTPLTNAASEKPALRMPIQLAADDPGRCRAACLEQMVLCKQTANAPSKDESDRRKAEEACDLNYRACVGTCK